MPRSPVHGRDLDAAEGRVIAALAREDVRGRVGQHLLPRAAMREQGHDVAHGAGGQEHRRLLAHQRRHAVTERGHGRVVARLLVPHLGAQHRLTHRRRRAGLRVGVEVDAHGGRPLVEARGREARLMPCRV
jgi:hypothetical protein